MCGIVGFLSAQSAVTRSQIFSGLKAIQHRGPDLQTCWIADNKKVGLGHARLSIMDLQSGQQPIVSEDGTVRAVVNGEFYEFEKIRQELIEGGAKFKTKSDSEILVHLYQKMGMRCFEKLIGEFAFILWDSRSQIVLAGRDRFGIKPLFYSQTNDGVYFASEPKALFAMGLSPEWNEEAVFAFHSTFMPSPTQSLYKNIKQLQPGHYLVATRDDVTIHEYWDFDFALENQNSAVSEEEAILAVRERVVEAVKSRMRADVDVGCYLSGGIDSAGILGISAEFGSKVPRSFTISFDNANYDELPVAKKMAERVGSQLSVVSVSDSDLGENFESAVIHSENVCVNGHGIAKYILSREVKNAGIRCVLTGEGADEIFGGYPHFKRDYMLHQSNEVDSTILTAVSANFAQATAVAKGTLINDTQSLPSSVEGLIGFTPSFMDLYVSSGRKIAPFLDAGFANEFAGTDFVRKMFSRIDLKKISGRSALHKSMYLWSKLIFPNYMLTVLGDRMEMANSIEGRLPFLDHRLAEYVNQLPSSMKMKNLTEKYILREALKPFVLDEIYNRQKHPFLAPPASIDPNGKLFSVIQDLLRSSSFRDIPFYNHNMIIGLLNQIGKMDTEQRMKVDPVLMFASSVAVLHKNYLMSKLPEISVVNQ